MRRHFILILFVLMQGWVHAQPLAFKHLTMADGLPGHRELQLCEDPYGRIWIGGIGGIGIFDGAQLETITRDDQWGLKGFQVNNIIRSRTGTMWVATNEAVQFLPAGAGRFETIESASEWPLLSYDDSKLSQISAQANVM